MDYLNSNRSSFPRLILKWMEASGCLEGTEGTLEILKHYTLENGWQ